MTTTKNNEHKKLNFSSEREQSQVCLNSAEHEKNQGRKVLNWDIRGLFSLIIMYTFKIKDYNDNKNN